MNVWWGGKAGVLLMFSLLGSFEGDPSDNASNFFCMRWDLGRAAPNFGWSLSWGFDRDLGRRMASDGFPFLGITRAIAWHLGWKVYKMITKNAGNQATILGCN